MSTLLGPRDENGIPVPMTVDESIASMKASLLKKIKRSAYVYRVDCGGCNGCEIEIFATLSPLFDAERFGLIRAIGMILLGFGIVQVGLSLKSHDPSQRANGFLTLAGGVIITFAKEILTLITG